MKQSPTRTSVNADLVLMWALFIFDGPVLEQVDDRKDYGEIRMKAIGTTEGLFLAVIYTDRGDTRRIISVRKANRKEREAWQSFVSL